AGDAARGVARVHHTAGRGAVDHARGRANGLLRLRRVGAGDGLTRLLDGRLHGVANRQVARAALDRLAVALLGRSGVRHETLLTTKMEKPTERGCLLRPSLLRQGRAWLLPRAG